MSVTIRNTLLGALAGASLLGGVASAEQGSPDAYCRQEAVDYGIQPEHVAEDVAGCVAAMGGAAAYAAPAEVAVPDESLNEEGGSSPDAQTGSEIQ